MFTFGAFVSCNKLTTIMFMINRSNTNDRMPRSSRAMMRAAAGQQQPAANQPQGLEAGHTQPPGQ